MRGMISFLMIDVGTVQVGLRLMTWICATISGEGCSGSPTIGDVTVDDAAVFDRLDRGRGQVHHDIAVAEREVGSGETVARWTRAR